MVIKKCIQCGDDFKTYNSYINRGNRLGINEGQFCSTKCYSENKKTHTPKRDYECEWCGKKLQMLLSDYNYKVNTGQRPRFCSRSCKSSLPRIGNRIVGGYRYMHAPDHPYRNYNKQVAEHRLVMEKHIGRYLKPKEVVHHKDLNKLNNDINNLQIVSRAEHEAIHLEYKRKLQKQWWTPERRAKMGERSRRMWAERKS
jgi:hypothetical protein